MSPGEPTTTWYLWTCDRWSLTGRQAEESLGRANIVVNRNTIPYDPQPPRTASGVRLGTPAITSRGFREADTRRVGELILMVLNDVGNVSRSRIRSATTFCTWRPASRCRA